MSWFQKFASPTGVERESLDNDKNIPPAVKAAISDCMNLMPSGAALLVETTGHIDSANGSLKIEIQKVVITK